MYIFYPKDYDYDTNRYRRGFFSSNRRLRSKLYLFRYIVHYWYSPPPLNAQGGEFSHRGIHCIFLPLYRLLSISIMLLMHYHFIRQKNVTQEFHPYSYSCIICDEKRVQGGRKKSHARKKIIMKLFLLYFGSKNISKDFFFLTEY